MSTHVTPDGRIEKGEKVIGVGDHVVDREDRDSKMIVVGIVPGVTADEYEIWPDTTVADYNEHWPADDKVVEVKFVAVDDQYLEEEKYAYPAGRLEVVQSFQ